MAKNKSSTETEHVKSSNFKPASVYCVHLIEKGAALSSTPAAAARRAKQQPQRSHEAVKLLSTNFALLIAVWPSLNPIELNLYTFIAAPLTAVSHSRLLTKCVPMWFILPSTFFQNNFFWWFSSPGTCSQAIFFSCRLHSGGTYHSL